MTNKETLGAEDEALGQMYKEDSKSGISTEDEQAFRELIEGQVDAHKDSDIEVKNTKSGETSSETVKGMGDKALRGGVESAMVIHSSDWHSEDK